MCGSRSGARAKAENLVTVECVLKGLLHTLLRLLLARRWQSATPPGALESLELLLYLLLLLVLSFEYLAIHELHVRGMVTQYG